MDDLEFTDNAKSALPYFGIPKIFPYAKQHLPMLVRMLLLLAVTSAVDIAFPLINRYAIDNLITAQTTDGVWFFVIIYVALTFVQTTATVLWLRISCAAEMYVGRDLKRASFNHLQTLSFSYFNTNSVGYVHSRIMSDTGKIGMLASWGVVDTFYSLLYIIGAISVMLTINTKLTLIVLFIVPIVVAISFIFRKHLTKSNREVREYNSKITGAINEGITGAKTTKTLVIEEKMERDFTQLTDKMKHSSVKLARLSGSFLSITVFCCYLAVALILWHGGIIAADGVILIGTLSVFTTYALGMVDPLQMIARITTELVNVSVNIERFTRLMETEPNVQDSDEVKEKYGSTFHPKRENWEPIKGDIVFDDVTFKYPDGEEYILENFNLNVPANTKVAIVGETGAGKSTLVNLVCRFFEPTSGRILIDGVDYKERSQLWLHESIGYVLQTPHLFSGTVAENLKYGNPDATLEDLDEAVKAVSATSVIEKLDKGYDSEVGEGGDMLSTGEKQLLSFARAILASPRIFVLDEATSSIDTKTEKLIQEATDTLLRGRTSFVIAHRLSTIRSADVILVVKDGKIVERGTHDELISKKTYYYELYTKQFENESTTTFLNS